jgi:glycosyltransferase involved in cell wall biosynthesis
MFPGADIFTLVASEEHIPRSLHDRHITQSFLSRLPFSNRIYRHLLPLYPLAVEHLDLREYDLVISSDAGPMKGVLVAPQSTHLCYCHSPMRYLWSNHFEYREQLSGIAKYVFSLSTHYVRMWDYSAAQRVTRFIANSENVRARISRYYARDSVVLYPPIDTALGVIADKPDDSYLTVGRMVRYKRMDLVIEACNRLRRKLRVIGSGPEEKSLRAIAGRSIEFLGHVDTPTLWHEYASCRALLFAADEDFGMVPLEAQSCGRPVLAYGKGGALESIAQGNGFDESGLSTGILFNEQSIRSISNAILQFERRERDFDPPTIRKWALRFDSTLFTQRFRALVEQTLAPGHESHRGADLRFHTSVEEFQDPPKIAVSAVACPE